MNKSHDALPRRLLTIIALSLALAGLTWYGHHNNPSVSLKMCVDESLKYDGKEIEIGMDAKVAKVFPDNFIIQQLGVKMRVEGDPLNASPGDFIRLKAVFHKEKYLEVVRLYVEKGRRYKIIISIFPVLLVIFLFLKTYKFDWQTLVFYRRSHA